jgi:TfoX/Sxy family transcriptional regulator of competence genes
MAWVKVPPEHEPLFLAALPDDPRVEIVRMFGGVAARVHGHLFAGLFGRSTMLALEDADRAEALALEGASLFDPMGNGRVMSDKVMLPERMMLDEVGLRDWVARAFDVALARPPKAARRKAAKRQVPTRKSPEKPVPAKKAARKTPKRAARKATKTSKKKAKRRGG